MKDRKLVVQLFYFIFLLLPQWLSIKQVTSMSKLFSPQHQLQVSPPVTLMS